METGHPSTRAVKSGSGNRALLLLKNRSLKRSYNPSCMTVDFKLRSSERQRRAQLVGPPEVLGTVYCTQQSNESPNCHECTRRHSTARVLSSTPVNVRLTGDLENTRRLSGPRRWRPAGAESAHSTSSDSGM